MQNHDSNMRGSVRTQTTNTTIERSKLELAYTCTYLALNDHNKALMQRLVKAVVADDVEALETLKADSPKTCTPVLDSFIADIQKGVKL